VLNFRFNWEGNLHNLNDETQRILVNPNIMDSTLDEILGKLKADPKVVKRFHTAYGRSADAVALLDALATYQRSLLTPGSRFDRWLKGDPGAIGQEELAGYGQFKSLGCISCHQGVNVGGNLYEKHGIFHPLASPLPEVLRVPSLRNVAATAPYFHDGSVKTLPEAVKQMGYAQLDRVLTDRQIAEIVAFLKTLTGVHYNHLVQHAGAGAAKMYGDSRS
jgi:cytochrome c peroxidase